MGMFDWYEPQPSVWCPRCHAEIPSWQGKDGPCGLFVWVQGRSDPLDQRVSSDARLDAAARSQYRLPERFVISGECTSEHLVEAHCGSTAGEPWFITRVAHEGRADLDSPLRVHDIRPMGSDRYELWLRDDAGALHGPGTAQVNPPIGISDRPVLVDIEPACLGAGGIGGTARDNRHVYAAVVAHHRVRHGWSLDTHDVTGVRSVEELGSLLHAVAAEAVQGPPEWWAWATLADVIAAAGSWLAAAVRSDWFARNDLPTPSHETVRQVGAALEAMPTAIEPIAWAEEAFEWALGLPWSDNDERWTLLGRCLAAGRIYE